MPNPLHILFCGTPDIAVPYLEALAEDPEFSVDLVITQPDKPVGRKQAVIPPPVKVKAKELGIKVLQPEDINKISDSARLPAGKSEIPGSGIRNLNPDFLVTVAYGQLIKNKLLNLPKIAPVNIHYSILPRWRGASPVQNAILAGDRKTGVSVQLMIEKLDAGDILGRSVVAIDKRDTYSSLVKKLEPAGIRLLLETLKNFPSPSRQGEDKAVYCKKLARSDGYADPNIMTASEIDRKVRALVPWPGVTCRFDGNEVKLIETAIEETDCSIQVKCAQDTILHVIRLKQPGKKEMTGKEWRRGIKKIDN